MIFIIQLLGTDSVTQPVNNLSFTGDGRIVREEVNLVADTISHFTKTVNGIVLSEVRGMLSQREMWELPKHSWWSIELEKF